MSDARGRALPWWTVRLVGEGTSRAPGEATGGLDGVQTREALVQALDQLRRQAGFQSGGL